MTYGKNADAGIIFQAFQHSGISYNLLAPAATI
jgi:hypothetical protein